MPVVPPVREAALESDFIGFLKYDGKLVDEGILDAKSGAKALHGFDYALRYFVTQERPDLITVEFPIPVRIERGSWTALIPHSVESWVLTAMGIGATTYLTTAAKKMAEHDFNGVGLKDAFKKGVQAVQWTVKIGKHLGTLAQKRLTGITWSNNNQEVSIPNERGEHLNVPRHYFELYVACPSSILSEVASVVEEERELTIGLDDNGKIEEVVITRKERAIFYAEEDETQEVLFPDLVHDQNVELNGIVTRGNERANTIGFLYKEHVLTCSPRQGSIVRFKQHLFLPCRIVGRITRLNDDTGAFDDPRPKIIFDDLRILEDDTQGRLFDDKP